MKTDKLILCLIGFMLLFTVAAAGADDTPKLTFHFTKADVPGAPETLVAEINNKGVMVGQFQDKDLQYYGYILDGKKLTRVDHPNGTNTFITGINFNGAIVVVGTYTDTGFNTVAFRYRPDTKQFEDIQPPEGATSLYTGGINDQGWIVGGYQDASGVSHGFLLQGKTYTTLDVPGAAGTYPYGINNAGNISLTWVNSKEVYAGSLYNYKSKTYKTVKVPGAGSSGSEGSFINNEGDVTFWWFDSVGATHGALCTECGSDGQKFYKFDYPKSEGTYPNGINDEKVLVGQFQHSFGGATMSFEASFK